MLRFKRWGFIFPNMPLLVGLILASLWGCGSSVTVGNENGDDRNNVTNTVEPNEAPENKLPPISNNGSNPICLEPQSPFDGFKVKFTYKPLSDSDGNAVVILPAAFRQRALKVELVYQGVVVESGRWAEFGNDDGEGPRQHWRFSLSGPEYVSEEDTQLIVRVTSKNGVCEWGLEDARERQD